MITDFIRRFVDTEKWRKDFGLDDLVRNFDYTEKEKVFEYYPQYYHKTDKVCKKILRRIHGRSILTI